MIKLVDILKEIGEENPYVDTSKMKVGQTKTDPISGATTTLKNVDPSTGKIEWDVDYAISLEKVYKKLDDLSDYLEQAEPGSDQANILNNILRLKEKVLGMMDQKEGLNESDQADTALKNKAKATGISKSILRNVYKKGLAAWKGGHRPGVSQHQWAMGRVNSFVTGKGGARKVDKKLWKRASKSRKKK